MEQVDRRSALALGLAAASAAVVKPAPPMMNPMICHILEGELRLEQDGKTFTAKKNYAWTCNTDTKEQAFNDVVKSLQL